jgi:DNA-binding transcriptional ArsR family regulator
MTPDTTKMAELADEATALLKALAHPARLTICCQLKDEEMSVGDIEERLDIRQPRLSRELAKLRDEGLVETRRESKVIFYRLADSPRVRAMIDAVCAVMLGKPAPSVKEPMPQTRVQRSGGYGVFAQPLSSTHTNFNGGTR